MILIIDNYDSFTYNLYQYVGELYPQVKVTRNDEITLDEIRELAPSGIIISPGPGYPKDAGISVEVVQTFGDSIPILGICLGHQAIIEAFGGEIVSAKEIMHGKRDRIKLDAAYPIFKNLNEQTEVARYHSLAGNVLNVPAQLSIIAQTISDDEIMGVCHKEYPIYGLQFHPESVITKDGKQIIYNFLKYIAKINIPEIDFLDNEQEKVLMKPFLKKVTEFNNLSEQEAEETMNYIMEGQASDSQIGAFMTALKMKGETIDEITGFARVMRQKALSVEHVPETLDIVGTGGDMSHTFNISTTTAFVVAACDVKVTKHGGRSVSSLSGSADVLESLGVKIELTPEQAFTCLKETGISFIFAPAFHKSMRFAARPRRETGIRSVFNILGPLSNPAAADFILLGVYEEALLEPVATVLMNLGIEHALIIYGHDGLDEISISAPTSICETHGNRLIKYQITPEELGLTSVPQNMIKGGDANENALILKGILSGKSGPKRDIVLLNAAAALYTAGKCENLQSGITLAKQAIDSGKAMAKLNELIKLTNTF